MVSVENFYWILYENLLRPCDIDCVYFYPFGTTNNASRHEYSGKIKQKYDRFSVFYDQEPLYDTLLYENNKFIAEIDCFSSFKSLKILANSEISKIKKEFCKSQGVLDWYYFYHGFAALDWFRCGKFLGDQHEVQNNFLFLNNLTQNKRSYRMALLARLVALDIHHRGRISFLASKNDCINEVNNVYTNLSDVDKKLITQHLINSKIDLPLVIDCATRNPSMSANFGHHEYKLWQSSLIHVVTETLFYDQKLHLTEKIFKPIVAERPFILVSTPGNLSYLKKYGFETFGRWIDESYDCVENSNERLDLIAKEIEKWSKKSISEIKDIHREMKEVLEFNKNHFFHGFKKIIVDELVNNFETCINLWNNSRVNYTCKPHPDLESVKKILLR